MHSITWEQFVFGEHLAMNLKANLDFIVSEKIA